MDPPLVEDETILSSEKATSPIGDEIMFEGTPVVSDDRELLRRGICRVKISEKLDAERWADELSQVTPLILAFEGDGEYAFYRNILEEPEFPFPLILFGGNNDELSEIGRAILKHFPVLSDKSRASLEAEVLSRELRLDDAFCVHYNMDQDDTSGAKHMDPSDITINMCLHKSKDARGSYVLFHGTKQLKGLEGDGSASSGADTTAPNGKDGSRDNGTPTEDRFLVSQTPGYATIHFGDHPHETTHLRSGSRTNIILTYLYTDPTRSDASTRSCY